MKKQFIPTFFALFLTANVFSQTTLSQKLQFAFDSVFTASGAKNVSAAVILPDGTIWKAAKGINTASPAADLKTDDFLAIGSITKTYTSTIILLIRQAGLLNLEDSIGKYLAPMPNIDPKITIRQLLTHTSGVGEYSNVAFEDASFNNPTKIWTVSELITNFVGAPQFAPGANFLYTNTNFLLAQLVIEKVAMMPYKSVLHQFLLAPNGLNSTFFYPQEQPTTPLAHLWIDITGDGVSDDVQKSGFSMNSFFSGAAGAGAIVTQASELATFMRKLNKTEILNAASLATMKETTPQSGDGYAMGIYKIDLDGHVGWGHDGNIYYTAACYHFEDKNCTIAVQSGDGADTTGIVFNEAKALFRAFCNFTMATATQNVEAFDGLSVSPNPAHSTASVRFFSKEKQPFSVNLMDATGRFLKNIVSEKQISDGDFEENIDVSSLAQGLYFLEISGKNGRSMQKLMIF
jgi:D-alanyl-D-alanine carboxypeptidase